MQIVGPEWRTMSPEEWIAHNIHRFTLWGWADYTFPDEQFNTWLRGVETVLAQLGPGDLGRLRAKYLTPE